MIPKISSKERKLIDIAKTHSFGILFEDLSNAFYGYNVVGEIEINNIILMIFFMALRLSKFQKRTCTNGLHVYYKP